MQLVMKQLDLVVRDMEASIAFYRAAGVEIPESAIWRTASGAHHARYAIVADPDGNQIGFMSPSDPARRGPPPDL